MLAQELKSFNIRVAIVEPGIIDTPMARRIEGTPQSPYYPQGHRMGGLFQAALAGQCPPAIIAQKIRGIIESGTWKLRHPAGPDAEPFLAWRAFLSEE